MKLLAPFLPLMLSMLLPRLAVADLVGPYTADAYTIFLTHFDESAGSSSFANSGAKGGYFYSVNCSVAAQNTNPPAVTTMSGVSGYSTTGPGAITFGNCLSYPTNAGYLVGYDNNANGSFNGDNGITRSTDQLLLTNLNLGNAGQSAWTIECLVAPKNGNPNGNLVAMDSCGANSTAANGYRGFLWGIGGGALTFTAINTPSGILTATATLPTNGPDALVSNAWYHAAVTYDGANVTFYWTRLDPANTAAHMLNATPMALGTVFGSQQSPLAIGDNVRGTGGSASANAPIYANIDEVRISSVCRAANQMQFFSLNTLVTNQGGLDFSLGGTLSTGLGYGSICPQGVSTTELKDMLANSRADIARVITVLGDNVYNFDGTPTNPLTFQQSWDGRTNYNFNQLTNEINRRISANANLKIIVQVALDGSMNWLADHPTNQNNAYYSRLGIPDYLDPHWITDSGTAITKMVNTINSSPALAGAVVGYELFNGASMDCNFPITITTSNAQQLFSAFLQNKYMTNPALQSAWGNPDVTFQNAWPITNINYAQAVQCAPLFIPSTYRPLADTQEFESRCHETVISNFACAIKTATGGNALMGCRSGELYTMTWDNEDSTLPGYSRSFAFFTNSLIDFYEVWDAYGATRYSSSLAGSAAPLMPAEGLRLLHKKFVLQDDYRVYSQTQPVPSGWDQNPGYGYDPTATLSINKLKRVFVSALTRGLNHYLFEMSYSYDQTDLLPLWDMEKTIMQKAQAISQSSVAEIAMVGDAETQKYISVGLTNTLAGQQWIDDPGFLIDLFQYPMNAWARVGAPHDFIFLDQIATARPYKLYIFYHTMALSTAQVQTIQSVLATNHACGVFVYADGMMDGNGNANTNSLGAGISALTGMTIKGSMAQHYAPLTPTTNYYALGGTLGNKLRWDIPSGEQWSPGWPVVINLFPSFVINDASTIPLATYTTPTTDVAIAMKQMANYTVVYSATPYLPPAVVRFLLKQAGGTTYIDTEDSIYANSSFIGINVDASSHLVLTTPLTATELYEVFNDYELSKSSLTNFQMLTNTSYLYYKGSRSQWQSIP
jgi:hypothetical protein